ncbi:peptide-methionine (S)-S-oxide reductase [Paenibacillus sp. CF384]|uniref:peptide-methionine (S)-S-oxide reductase MsrA n=1 Tax=Paenibacillus sp. CF384 TaxID=1884382 RepID=UPI00089ACC6A|nr:peptide-methionine (S)-S-oxide reductase [Paenibacillus sp. CF384]SDX92744.1 peptide-methionine (S)-S-oxide reductase [Paenibacillus sp. CF384]
MNDNNTQTITLGMGCFWGPDALFGQLAGITRTRVGYTGGTTDNPATRHAGDHTEMVEIEFDPAVVKLETILDLYWNSHKPANINNYRDRLYNSLILYRDQAQLSVIQEVMQKRGEQGSGVPDTELTPFSVFYPAEDRNQKYYLKRYPDAVDKLRTLFKTEDDLTNATLAARLNGIAKGFANMDTIIQDIRTWQISSEEQEEIIQLIKQIKW